MTIAFTGRVTLKALADCGKWNRPLPDVKWGFPLGSEIVKRLVARGHTVVVVTEHMVDAIERFKCQTERGGLEVWLVPSRRRSRWTFLTLFSKETKGMRTAIREIKPDVVFAQWTYHNAYAGLTSGYPTLVVAHDSPWRIAWVNGGLQAWIKAFYSQMLVFPRVKNLTTVSPYIVNELRRFNRYRAEVKIIPNGIAANGVFDHIEPRTSIRAKATTVAVVADWSALKNVKTFFSALDWSARKNFRPRIRAVVFGSGLCWDGPAGDWLKKSGLNAENLELRGLQERSVIAKFLRDEADIFCSPSLEESFGMVFIEAMLQGVPCVGGEKSGAVPWVLGNGDAGVLTDVTKPEVLARTLERVMLDYELRKRLSEAGVKRVKENFDIERVVDMYEMELKRVAGIR